MTGNGLSWVDVAEERKRIVAEIERQVRGLTRIAGASTFAAGGAHELRCLKDWIEND